MGFRKAGYFWWEYVRGNRLSTPPNGDESRGRCFLLSRKHVTKALQEIHKELRIYVHPPKFLTNPKKFVLWVPVDVSPFPRRGLVEIHGCRRTSFTNFASVGDIFPLFQMEIHRPMGGDVPAFFNLKLLEGTLMICFWHLTFTFFLQGW